MNQVVNFERINVWEFGDKYQQQQQQEL